MKDARGRVVPPEILGTPVHRDGGTATTLSLRLMGTPEIVVSGEPLRVDTRKAVALLAYLAVEGRQRRDRLTALLWPDAERTHARGALRRTLSVTLKALGGVHLEGDTAALALVGNDIMCDVWALDEHVRTVDEHGDDGTCPLCLDKLESAVRLRRGDFLEHFSLREGPEFGEWQLIQDGRLRRVVAGALDQLVRGHAWVGALDAAAAFAEERLVLDPLHERTHRQLMLLHAWRGQRSEAIQQYRACVAALHAELGVAPLDDTTSLYERIVAHDIPPRPNGPSALKPVGIADSVVLAVAPIPQAILPLMGRTDELRTMIAAFEAIEHNGHVVGVEGEPGIGKSRLLDEFAAHAANHGSVVLFAKCHDDERGVPHAPVVELLRAALVAAPGLVADLPNPELAEVAQLIPEIARARRDLPSPVGRETAGARGRFHDVLAGILTDASVRTMVVVDDVHHADRASLAVLAHLARRLRSRPICLVLSWCPGTQASQQTIRKLIHGAREDGRATVIVPQRLTRADVARLVVLAAPNRAEEISERVHGETEGLPLLVVDYLAALACNAEDWRLPVAARDWLLTRLDPVRGVARQVLSAAAVIGDDFNVELAQLASGRSPDDTMLALDQLVSGGMLRVASGSDGEARYGFSHNKMRDLVYEQTDTGRRRLLHGRVSDAIRARTRGLLEEQGVAALLAHHEGRAGRREEAARHHHMAAEHARSVLAFGDARAHLAAAMELGHPDVAALHEALGDIATLEGDYVAALAGYETSAAHLRDVPARRAGVEQKLAGVHLRRGDRVAADAHLGAALQLVGHDGALADRARILADRSLAALRSHDDHEAEVLAVEALSVAEAGGDLGGQAQAHNLLGMTARRSNRPDDARRHATRSLELAIAMGDTSARIAALNNLGLVERAAGRMDAAATLHEEALLRCQSLGDRHREAALANNLADALYAGGRRDEAMTHLKDAVAKFAEVDDPEVLRPEIWNLVDW